MEAYFVEQDSIDTQWSTPDIHSKISSLNSTQLMKANETPSTENQDMDINMKSSSDPTWPWGAGRDDFPALTAAPVMEGRWWPKKAYSTLSFDTPLELPISTEDNLFIWIWLLRDLDPHGRILTVWFDNQLVNQYLISSIQSGFKDCVVVQKSLINPELSRHRVEISIDYGGYIVRGWKLLYAWIGIGDSFSGSDQTPPLDNNDYPYELNELTPRTGKIHCAMQYDVVVGESTYLNIETVNVADTSSRTAYVYIENNQGQYQYIATITSPGAYEVYLGDFTDSIHRKLKIRYNNMPDIDYAKRITQLGVHYIGCKIEIDYMPNTRTSKLSANLASMNAYYKIHAYHRVDWEYSTELVEDIPTSQSDHVYYWTNFYDHSDEGFGHGKWEYLIFVEELEGAAGWHLDVRNWFGYGWRVGDYGIGISDACIYTLPYAIMHEYGHHIYISWDNPEDYCDNSGCVMTDSGQADWWYCFYHWTQRLTY